MNEIAPLSMMEETEVFDVLSAWMLSVGDDIRLANIKANYEGNQNIPRPADKVVIIPVNFAEYLSIATGNQSVQNYFSTRLSPTVIRNLLFKIGVTISRCLVHIHASID